MNPHFKRAELLFHQSRFDLAEEQLRLALADDPDYAAAHGLLALCLLQKQNAEDATTEALRAVELAPEMPFSFYVLALVFLRRNRLEDAENAAKRAIELNPYDADLHQILGGVYMALRRWPAALERADEGLRLDAEHIGCSNLRAMALVKLGRKNEAEKVVEGVLSRDPEDAFSHANQGWTALHQNDPRKALVHFREALRLDPTLEFAQAGMVEALKARHLVYRLMLRWFLWMSTLGRKWQWAMVLALFFGTRMIGDAAVRNPDLGPILWPVWGLLIGFCLMSWLADPLFNLMLRLNRFGRHILNREQIWAANATGICLLAALSFLAYGLIEDHSVFLMMALATGVYLIVVTGLFRVPKGPRRLGMGLAAIFLAGTATQAFWLMFKAYSQHPALAEPKLRSAWSCLDIYFPGVMFFSIATNILMSIRQQR